MSLWSPRGEEWMGRLHVSISSWAWDCWYSDRSGKQSRQIQSWRQGWSGMLSWFLSYLPKFVRKVSRIIALDLHSHMVLNMVMEQSLMEATLTQWSQMNILWFVFLSLPLEAAEPLLCAGITVYSPLRYLGLHKPGLHVGVVGLGHMVVKYAKAFGANVTVISTSL